MRAYKKVMLPYLPHKHSCLRKEPATVKHMILSDDARKARIRQLKLQIEITFFPEPTSPTSAPAERT